MHDRIARITGGEQHFEVGMSLSRLFGELAAIHPARKPNIREQDRDFGMLVKDLQGVAAHWRLR